MTGKLSKNFHGVGIGPLSKILAVKRIYPFVRHPRALKDLSEMKSTKAFSKVLLVKSSKKD